MLVASNDGSELINAWDAEKDEAPFFCPECKAEVVLKKGQIRQHHFAHTPPFNCMYGEGESEYPPNSEATEQEVL